MSYRYKMNPDWKKAWVSALRSDDYKQGRPGCLVDEDGGYCCLGVLQELIDPNNMEGNGDGLPSRYCVAVAGLPKYRRIRYSTRVSASKKGIVLKLAFMNDGEGRSDRASFKEIADFIEENL